MVVILFLALMALISSFLLPEPPGGAEMDWAMRLGLRVFAGLMAGWAVMKR